jgi:DNA polymerase
VIEIALLTEEEIYSEPKETTLQKTKKQIKIEQQATIDMNDPNSFCHKCSDIIGRLPRMNCARGRQLVGRVLKNPDIDIMFVGEAPGDEEVRLGEFFVGPSGKKLERWIEEFGFDSKKIYLDNAIRCELPRDLSSYDTTPKKKIIKNCQVYLWQEIARIKPKILVLLGNAAMWSVLDIPKGILNWAGREIIHKELNCFVLPTIHPAAIMRRPELEDSVYDHLSKIPKLLRKKLSFRKLRWKMLETSADFCDLNSKIIEAKEIVIDIETKGLNCFDSENFIIGIGVCFENYKGYFVPVYNVRKLSEEEQKNYKYKKKYDWDYTSLFLTNMRRKRLEMNLRRKVIIGHNLAFDVKWLKYDGYTNGSLTLMLRLERLKNLSIT